MNMNMIIATLLLTGCTLPSSGGNKQIIPLLLSGETITNSQAGLPMLAAGFWTGISNNVFTVGNINTGFSKQFNSVGMANSAALSPDCSKVYVAEVGGTYVYDLFTGTHTFLTVQVGNMGTSPDGTVTAFGSGNSVYFITGNTVTLMHTYAEDVNHVFWKDANTLIISMGGAGNIYHLYTVPIGVWTTTRLTLTENLNTEFEYAANGSDGIQYYIGDSGSGTSNNFWKSTNWQVFQSIPLNVARNLVKDQNGQVYVAQGVVNGSTEMRMVGGEMVPVANMPVANNTIYDFCKLNPKILNQ
jgi:hypothetical protein